MSDVPVEEYDVPRLTPVVQVLLGLCIGVAFLQTTLVTPDDTIAWLGFQWSHVDRAWWTLGSYTVVHTGLWQLIVNLFILLLFGPRVEHAWGSRAFAIFFLWCAVGGALAHTLFVKTGVMLGASAGVFGVMLAYAWLWPKDELFLLGVLPIRAWTLLSLATATSLAIGINDPAHGGVAYFAHLGGFAAALLYLKRPNPVSIDQLRQRVAAAPDPNDDTPRAIPRTLPRSRRGDDVDEIVAQSKAVFKHQARTAPVRIQPRDTKSEQLNRVLDKISEGGLDSLTPSERLLLEEMSRRLRDR